MLWWGCAHVELLGCRQDSGASLLFQVIALAPGRDYVTVVKQAVEDRRHDGIVEDLLPLADGPIRRQQEATAAPQRGGQRHDGGSMATSVVST